MNFQEACDELSCLLEKSNGKPIPFEDGQKIFTPIKKYTDEEVNSFQNKYNITLPDTFRHFLKVVGAGKFYEDPDYGGGFDVVELEKIEKLSEKYGEDYHQYFPQFLIVANHYSMGDAGAFDLNKPNKFAIIPHDECLEEYLEWEKGWIFFENWLLKCVLSFGEDTL